MRILQVVSLISPDGAFGGPTRVALNQSAELIRQGHEVTLAAGTRGYRDVPTEADGVPLRLFPTRTALPFLGFSGKSAPGLTRWVRVHLREFDVVHIHFGRDLVVMPIAALARRHGIPYVVQTHGMVTPSGHPLAGPLDALWTRRLLAGAAARFYLTDQERRQIRAVMRRDIGLIELPNGVPAYRVSREDAGTGTPEVLFLARLHARKRPVMFVEMAHRLLREGMRARFTLIGPDEGEAAAVLAAIGGEERIRWEGPVAPDRAAQRMAQASAYVLPAEREPYPMTVLEAMSVGLPVVVCSDCGLAPVVKGSGGGRVADGTVEGMAAAVHAILSEPREYGRRAQQAARTDFAMSAVADRLVAVYREAGSR